MGRYTSCATCHLSLKPAFKPIAWWKIPTDSASCGRQNSNNETVWRKDLIDTKFIYHTEGWKFHKGKLKQMIQDKLRLQMRNLATQISFPRRWG